MRGARPSRAVTLLPLGQTMLRSHGSEDVRHRPVPPFAHILKGLIDDQARLILLLDVEEPLIRRSILDHQLRFAINRQHDSPARLFEAPNCFRRRSLESREGLDVFHNVDHGCLVG